jgi:crotonobetainyl-CoA:carnitine CoA-transferase CaiB-like acyl-CoA transferase
MSAIVCALVYRERTSRRQYLDISLLDSYFNYHDMNVQMLSVTKGEYKPTRSGLYSFYVAPVGKYKAKNGYLLIQRPRDDMFG